MTGVPAPRSTQRYVGADGTIRRRTERGFGGTWRLRFALPCFFAWVDVVPPFPAVFSFLLLPPVRPRITKIASTTPTTTRIAVPGPGGPRDGRGLRRSCRLLG